MIKLVIFDLDGVIVSTDNLHYTAWKAMADKEGIYFDEKINHRLRGVSRMDSLEIILEKSSKEYSDDEKINLAKYKNDLYVKYLETLKPKDILPGVLDLLKALKQNNIKIAIGSSSKNAKRILAKLEIEDLFDAISDGTNITHSKPNPEVFLKACDMLGYKFEECAVVEDALSGIEAAKRANMLSFAVGDAKKSPLKDYDFEQLLSIVI